MINCTQLKKEIDKLLKIHTIFHGSFFMYDIDKKDFILIYEMVSQYFSFTLRDKGSSFRIDINHPNISISIESVNIEQYEQTKYREILNNVSILLQGKKTRELKGTTTKFLNKNNELF